MTSSSAVASTPTDLVSDQPKTSSRKLVTFACMLVMVLASMETTIAATAMPSIIGSLHGLEHYAWVASIFLLACTVSMPLYGRLADTIGRKRTLLSAIALFLLASLLASTAQTMPQLIAWRGLQGLGAGGIMPVVLTVLGDIFTLQERAKIQGLFSAIWGTSALAGPALGALLVNTLGWRSIFYVNLPPGLLAATVLLLYYHESRSPQLRTEITRPPSSTSNQQLTTSNSPPLLHHLDLPGFSYLSLSTSALLVAVSVPFTALLTPTLLIVSAIAAALFIRHERRTDDPILPPDLLLRRDIWPPVLATALLGIGFLSLDTYVPLFVQGGRGGGATAAATVVTPVMLAWASSGMFAAPLVVKRGFRFTATLGALLMTLGFSGLLASAALNLPAPILIASLFLTGLGLGPASMSCLLAVQNAVDYAQRGTVTSAIGLARTLGGAIGIGLHGALFTLLTRHGFQNLETTGHKPAEILDPAAAAKLPPNILASARELISDNLLYIFASMLAFAAIQIFISLKVPAAKAAHKPKAGEGMEVG
jgi:MFS family permease